MEYRKFSIAKYIYKKSIVYCHVSLTECHPSLPWFFSKLHPTNTTAKIPQPRVQSRVQSWMNFHALQQAINKKIIEALDGPTPPKKNWEGLFGFHFLGEIFLDAVCLLFFLVGFCWTKEISKVSAPNQIFVGGWLKQLCKTKFGSWCSAVHPKNKNYTPVIKHSNNGKWTWIESMHSLLKMVDFPARYVSLPECRGFWGAGIQLVFFLNIPETSFFEGGGVSWVIFEDSGRGSKLAAPLGNASSPAQLHTFLGLNRSYSMGEWEDFINYLAILRFRDLFGMVKTWPELKGCWWPPTRGWKGHELNHLVSLVRIFFDLLTQLPEMGWGDMTV